MKRAELRAITGLTLLSAIFKLAALTSRSLWLDEGYTLYRTASSWSLNLRNQIDMPLFGIASDPHPPVYFLLVKAVAEFAGNNELLLKLVSAFAGVLFVPLMFVMARRLFSARAGHIAALFAALCPLAAWYSDELRSYSLIASEAALCIYLGYLAITSPKMTRWLAWGLALVVAQFTHWAFLGFLMAHMLAVLPTLVQWMRSAKNWKPGQRVLLVAGGIALAAGLGASAWLFDAPGILKRMTTGAEYGYAFVPLHTFIASIFSGTLFGVNFIDPTNEVLVWLSAVGFAVCLGVLWRGRTGKNGRLAFYFVMASTILPPAVWFLISLIKPNYHGIRHLMMVVPPILAVFAAAIDLALKAVRPAARWAGRAGLAVLLMCFSVGFVSVYVPTSEKEDNWREMAQVIRDDWQEGDVLLGNAGTPLHVLRSYIGAQVPIPTLYTGEFGGMSADQRAQFYAGHLRLWFANTGGAPLDKGEATDLADKRVLAKIHVPARTTTLELLLIELHPQLVAGLPHGALPVLADVNASATQIAGYAIGPGSPFAEHPSMKLSLFWKRGSTQTASPNLALRMENNAELWLDWNSDARLQNPPPGWQGQTFWQIDYDVPVPLGLPDQAYQFKLTASAGGQTQVVDAPLSRAAFECCLRIARWNPARVSIPQLQTGPARMDAVRATFDGQILTAGTDDARVAEFGDVTLVKTVQAEMVRPGDVLPVALNWRVKQTALAGWENEVRLEPFIGGAVASAKRAAGTADAPVSGWKIGEIYRDQLSLQVPYGAAPGVYRLQLERVRPGRAADVALIGLVRVEDYPRSPVPGPIPQTLNAKIGEMTLLGWQPPPVYRRNVPLELHTFWQFGAQPQREGVLFVHVVSSEGKVVAQYDNAPLDGKRATQTFRAGDGLDQLNPITLQPDLPAGEYTIYAGIYNRKDVTRWEAAQDGTPAKDNLVRLGAFTLGQPMDYTMYLPVITR
ncbi:MAG TPA: glycosyltransferase family 39 protein [Thermoflexales bacterium]|nr:glycosyltransferase family 39 protein [Thermoflexales bacterium]HQW33945.1 glycosyltransferase family 39 protein [Thermoflexales bacterium]